MKFRAVALAGTVALVCAGLVGAPARGVQAAVVPTSTCSVFPSDNIWNTDISQLPVNAQSATWVGSTTPSSGMTHPDFGGPPYGIPFNVVSSTHPTSTYTFQYASESDPGAYPSGGDLLIEQGSDAHLLAINRDTCKLYETFSTDAIAHTAGSGAIFDLVSNALRPAGWTSADAAGLPIFPGLLRVDEVHAGFIGHAIRFTVHNTNDTYIWPARHHAGIADASLPPMGARFRLKAGFDISTFGTEAQVVLTAFKHYGLVVADNGSDWYFQGTEDPGWDDPVIADLKKIPVNQFEAVDESSLMISPDSAQAGRVPSAATAPTAIPRSGGAIVMWTAPANGGQPITSYTINGTPSGHAVVSGGPTTAILFGLANGISYTFTVTAVNAVGAGSPSPPSNAVVPNDRLAAQGSAAAPPGRPGASQSTAPTGPRPPRLADFAPALAPRIPLRS